MSELETNLMQFTGTEHYYRHALRRTFYHTDGVQYLAEHAGAYWLIDVIASYQADLSKRLDTRLRDMQFWHLQVHPNKSATVTCVADSGETPAVCQHLEYTDFPMQEIDIWVAAGEMGMTAMLKSEY